MSETRVNKVIDLWAKREVIDNFEVCKRLGIDALHLGLRGTPDVIRAVPDIDDVTIVHIEAEDGETVQIGDYTWDHEAAHIEIRYKLRGWSSTFTCSASLELPDLMAKLLQAADDTPKDTP